MIVAGDRKTDSTGENRITYAKMSLPPMPTCCCTSSCSSERPAAIQITAQTKLAPPDRISAIAAPVTPGGRERIGAAVAGWYAMIAR